MIGLNMDEKKPAQKLEVFSRTFVWFAVGFTGEILVYPFLSSQ
jgi:hypothetical protein